MFEEEADKAETKMIVESNGVYSKFKNYKEGFKDGANLGYNKAKEDADKMKSQFLELCNLKNMRIKELEKANEWHYPSKDDLPEDMKNVIINAFDYGINTCYVAHRLNGKWKSNCSSETFVRVIAWKELPEPPKEIKENE